jgi:hypothetical protein
LLGEIESLKTGDDAAVWARRRLGAKSTLHSADAAHVERGFQDRLMVKAKSRRDLPLSIKAS